MVATSLLKKGTKKGKARREVKITLGLLAFRHLSKENDIHVKMVKRHAHS